MTNNPMLKDASDAELSELDKAILAIRTRPLSEEELSGVSTRPPEDQSKTAVTPFFELKSIRNKKNKDTIIPFVGIKVSF